MISKVERSLLTIFLCFSIFIVSYAQTSLSYIDNYKNALEVARAQDKFLYSIYIEDDPLKEAYLSYLTYNDSLSALLNEHFIIFIEKSEYNMVEISSNSEDLLAALDLNTEIDSLYAYVKRMVDSLSLVKQYLRIENRLLTFRDPEPNHIELFTYLACAKDVLQLKKGNVLEMFMKKLPREELADGRHFELINFHTESFGNGYTYLKRFKELGAIKDSVLLDNVKSTIFNVLESIYVDVLEYDIEEVTKEYADELGWYINNFGTQEMNSRYRYMTSKYGVAKKKKGDKNVLFVNSKLYVQNWIMSQVGTDAPFMQADELGYDLVAVIDLLLKRKIDKKYYPEMEPWVTAAVKILPGFQSTRAYSEWLKRTGNKQEHKIQKNKYKTFRSQLPKDVVKQKENYLKSNLDSHTILLDFCDDFFYFQEVVEL
ncbi:MAG: hypothetical protein HKN68_18995 [Saprospiraceae bacterium]|nr:hypothetical protein [Saprospiraceae bacterium]